MVPRARNYSVDQVDALGGTGSGTVLRQFDEVLRNLRLALLSTGGKDRVALPDVREEIVAHLEQRGRLLFAEPAVLAFRLVNPYAHFNILDWSFEYTGETLID
jgi:hypothetical protein